ncbi:hypothetical protein QW131_11330 [Roseibium salinum]|nr:hypothetical protein [Roseibium salinum]
MEGEEPMVPRSRIAVAGAISAFACLTLPGAAAAQQPMVPAMDVAGVETVPIDGDIDHYRAVLVETEEGGGSLHLHRGRKRLATSGSCAGDCLARQPLRAGAVA